MINGDEVDDAAMSADTAEELFKARPRSFFDEYSQQQQDHVFEEQELQMGAQFRSTHSIDFKFYVSELAQSYNNTNVAEAFNITVKQVKEWRKQNLLLKQAYYEKNVAIIKANKDNGKTTPELNSNEQNFAATSTSAPDTNGKLFNVGIVTQPTMSETVNSSSTQKLRKKASYSSEYKLKAVAYAEMTTNRAAAREFNVHEKRIREWRKNKEVLQNSPKDCRRLKGAGRKPLNQQLEDALYEWICLTAKERSSITRGDLQQKAIEISLANQQNSKFSPTPTWIENFLKRYDLNLKVNDNSATSSSGKSCHSDASETFPPPTMVREDSVTNPFEAFAVRYQTINSNLDEKANEETSRSIPFTKTI